MTDVASGVGAGVDNMSEYVLSGDPDLRCLTFEGVTHTRGEIAAAAAPLSDALRELGVGRDSLVAIFLPNTPTLITSLLGVWATGAAVAPLGTTLGERDLRRSLAALRPSCVITDPESWGLVAAVTEGPALLGPDGVLHRPAASDATPHAVPPGTALVMHTSGTTGAPKAVLLSHSSVIGGLESLLRMLGVRPRPRNTDPGANLVAFSLSHLGGLYNMLLTFRNNRRVVLLRRFEVEPFLDAVEQNDIRSVVLAPTMIRMLLDAEVAPERLGALRFVRSGSAPLPASLARRFWNVYGIPVLNCYAQTETAGEVIGWTAPDFEKFSTDKLGSVGRPHPGISIMFRSEDGSTSAPGELGELCVSTPFAMSGYLSEDMAQRLTPEGYLRTGDLGYVDEDGFVWLAGRRSDVIVCGGFKVMPEEVEDVLREHPSVADVMVAGVPDERLGEVPNAFVVVAAGASSDSTGPVHLAEELTNLVRDSLSKYKAPRAVVFVPELPRTANGKLLRSQASALLPA